MLNQEELQKRITCAALLPEPGPEVLKEVCRSHLEALARLDEAAATEQQEHIMPNYTDATTNTYLLTGSARNPYDKIAELEQHLREAKSELARMQAIVDGHTRQTFRPSEVLKEFCRSHLEFLPLLDESARRTTQPGRSSLVDNLTLGQIIGIVNTQEFKVDNEYSVPVFDFSSLDHPGCMLHAPVGVRLDAVVVRARQISRKVTDSMVNVSQQEKLRVDISGTLHGITDSRNRRDDPFDITILAYSPADDRDYRLVIQGCSVTHATAQQSNAVAEFTAQKILRWTADPVATHDAE